MIDPCILCQDGYPIIKVKGQGEFHEALGFTWRHPLVEEKAIENTSRFTGFDNIELSEEK
jgi:hypothetical protein